MDADLQTVILTLRMLAHPQLGPSGISDDEKAQLVKAADLLEHGHQHPPAA